MDHPELSTRDRILDAAEALLQRHGPAKTNVVDVARALGMSHANVYKFFASKSALRDAVIARWLHKVEAPLAQIAASKTEPEKRLRTWIWALIDIKRTKVLADPEMFATYHLLADEARDVVDTHVKALRGQLAAIIADGLAGGQFNVSNKDVAATVVMNATLAFHHPYFVQQNAGSLNDSDSDIDSDIDATLNIMIAGLKAGGI